MVIGLGVLYAPKACFHKASININKIILNCIIQSNHVNIDLDIIILCNGWTNDPRFRGDCDYQVFDCVCAGRWIFRWNGGYARSHLVFVSGLFPSEGDRLILQLVKLPCPSCLPSSPAFSNRPAVPCDYRFISGVVINRRRQTVALLIEFRSASH